MITDEQVQRVIDAIDRKHQAKLCATFNHLVFKMGEVMPPDQIAQILARHFLNLLQHDGKKGVVVAVHKVGTVVVEAYVTSKADVSWH